VVVVLPPIPQKIISCHCPSPMFTMHGWRRPVRLLIAAILFVFLSTFPASAQRGPEDVTRACPLITDALRKVAVAAFTGRCMTSCRGCGCKGGPGYRAASGCVGYADIISKCGPPPHREKGCVPECARVVAVCAAFGRSRLKEAAKAANIVVEYQGTELPDDEPEEEEGNKPPTPIVPSVSAPATATQSP
jgi:hypothetical protein